MKRVRTKSVKKVDRTTCEVDVYLVHLFQDGKYVSTVNRPFSNETAERYSEARNKAEAGLGLQVVVSCVEVSTAVPRCPAVAEAIEPLAVS